MPTSGNKTRTIPTDRVRALAEIIKLSWDPFTDDEKLDLLVMINKDREPLDALAVEKMLESTGGNITIAAKYLGIARRTMQNRMRAFGMPTGKHGRKFK